MTAPLFLDALGLRDLSQRLSEVHVRGNVEQQMTVVRASVELDEAARRIDALAGVTAERDQARQTLTDAPHGLSATYPFAPCGLFAGRPCDCWKATI